MAKIKYLKNGDVYGSMVAAIKAENIAYGSFYNNFKKLWGRFSLSYWADEGFDVSMAKQTISGVEVLGANRIILFSDTSVGFKWTKKLCKLLGADYDELYSNRGDVDYFYVELNGLVASADFTQSSQVKDAFENIAAELQSYNIDKIKIDYYLDTQFYGWLSPDMDTYITRTIPPQLDYNTGEFYEDEGGSFAPSIRLYAPPTYDSYIEEIWSNDPQPVLLDTITHYFEVEGEELSLIHI